MPPYDQPTVSHSPYGGPSPYERLRALVRLERGELGAIVVYGALVGLTTLAVPVAAQALVTSVAMGTLRQPVAALTVLLMVVLGFSAALRVAQVKLVELLQERLFVRSALELAWKLPRTTPDAFGGCHGPEQVNRFLDTVGVQKAVAGLLLDGLAIALQLVVGLALLGFYHPFLLAFDVLLIAALVFVVFVLGRRGVTTSVAASKAKYAVASWLQEIARHPVGFRSEAGQTFALSRADGLLVTYLKKRREHFQIVLRQTVGALALHVFASASVLGLGAILVLNEQLTLGQLVAAELVVNAVAAGISKLGKQFETYYDLLASLDKVGQLTDIATEREDGARLEGHGPLRLVVEGGEAGERFEVAPGTQVVVPARLAGRSNGALDAAFGLAVESDVRVDGVPLTELSLGDYRSAVAIVRGPDLFEGSVSDNVRLGREEVTLADVRRAIERVGLGDVVARLPSGLQSPLTSYGGPLTGEQSTRVAIARALAGRPRLLLLDGALDALPDDARAAIVEALVDCRGVVSVVVSTARADVMSALAPRSAS